MTESRPLEPRGVDPFAAVMASTGMTPRPQQLDLIDLIDRAALGTEGKLIAQAGTGTGKSYVLLAKAVDYGRAGRPAVVATVTNHLGRQYIDKDAPVVESATGARITRLIGRSHYLCASSALARRDGVAQPPDLAEWAEMSGREKREAVEVSRPDRDRWLSAVTDDAAPWATFWESGAGQPVDDLGCPGSPGCRARLFGGCGRARAGVRAALEADVVVTNFHVLMSHMLYPDAGILPPTAMVLVDEAHGLPEVVASFLDVEISPGFGRETVRAARRHEDESSPLWVRAVDIAQAYRRAAVRRVGWSTVDPWISEVSARPSPRLGAELAGVLDRLDAVRAGAAASTPPDTDPADTADLIGLTVLDQLRVLARSATDLDVVPSVHRPPPDDEEPPDGADPEVVYLRRADVAPAAAAMLGERAVLVSATVPESLPARCGWPGVVPVDVGTPFDYGRQVRTVWVSRYDGRKSPRGETAQGRRARFAARLDELAYYARGGATLVLASSHADVAMLVRELSERLAVDGVTVLRQPRSGATDPTSSTSAVVERLRAAPLSGERVVLVGTDTIATGLDVPGEALCHVAWWSLPLGSTPLVDERRQRLFPGRGVSFPGRPAPGSHLDGRLRTKVTQGVGRLIRTVSDSGDVLLCDARFWAHLDGATSILDGHLRTIARAWWPQAQGAAA